VRHLQFGQLPDLTQVRPMRPSEKRSRSLRPI
jgi:hypothetical protein